MYKVMILAALALAWAAPAGAGDLGVLEAAPGVLIFRPDTAVGNPTTVALLGANGTVLLDAGIPESATAIAAYLAAHQLPPVTRVVTTHAHRDHVDGLAVWGPAGAEVIATAEQKVTMQGSPVLQAALDSGAAVLPTVLIGTDLTLTVDLPRGPTEVLVRRPPHRSGHTDGDLLIHLPALDLLYVGDYFFWSGFPIIDTGGGGSVAGYLADLDWIAAGFPAGTRVIPGHNAFAPAAVELPSLAEFTNWKNLVKQSLELVRTAHAAGVDLDGFVAAGLPGEFAEFDRQPRYVPAERWIRAAWEAEAERVGAASGPILDTNDLDAAHWFDFLLGSWDYTFSTGSGAITYTRARDGEAIRGELEGTINGTRFAGGSLTFPDPAGLTWHRRWIDTLGNTLEGLVTREKYGESTMPALVSRFAHADALFMHVWYDIRPDRFETDLLVSRDGGQNYSVVRRMPYVRQ